MVARLVRDQEVVGSNPATSTIAWLACESQTKDGCKVGVHLFVFSFWLRHSIISVSVQFEITLRSALLHLPYASLRDESRHFDQKKT